MKALWILAAGAWILSPTVLDWSLLVWLGVGVGLSLLSIALFPSMRPKDPEQEMLENNLRRIQIRSQPYSRTLKQPSVPPDGPTARRRSG